MNIGLINGYTEKEAKEKISERQKLTSLESFQNRYGKEEGLNRYTQRIENFSKTYNNKDIKIKNIENKSRGRTKAQLINEYGIEKTTEIIKKRQPKSRAISKLETKIFNELIKSFPQIKKQKILFYNNNFYIFDIALDNILIEINGTWWHADPRKYDKNSILYRGKSAQEIWDYDKNKIEAANKCGYIIFSIWENEIIKNFDSTINFIKNIFNQFKNN